MKLLRSIAAVVISYALIYALVWVSDPVLSRLYPGMLGPGQVPPVFLLRISTYIFAIASLAGGALCVRMAPTRPGLHLLILFVLGEIVGVGFSIANWNKGWPHWYSLVWLGIYPVCLWLGGMMRKRKEARTAAAAV